MVGRGTIRKKVLAKMVEPPVEEKKRCRKNSEAGGQLGEYHMYNGLRGKLRREKAEDWQGPKTDKAQGCALGVKTNGEARKEERPNIHARKTGLTREG